jgi:hypothetical protein
MHAGDRLQPVVARRDNRVAATLVDLAQRVDPGRPFPAAHAVGEGASRPGLGVRRIVTSLRSMQPRVIQRIRTVQVYVIRRESV